VVFTLADIQTEKSPKPLLINHADRSSRVVTESGGGRRCLYLLSESR
jgi:hypothetical protein